LSLPTSGIILGSLTFVRADQTQSDSGCQSSCRCDCAFEANFLGGLPKGETDRTKSSYAGAPTEGRLRRDPFPNLYYVLVCLSKLARQGMEREPHQFFVLTQPEAVRLMVEREYDD
jgi:hypothetical protein